MSVVRVLIVDDQTHDQHGVRVLVSGQDDMGIVGEVRGGPEALGATGLLHPDVILLGVGAPGPDGGGAVRSIRSAYPSVKIVALSDAHDAGGIAEAFRAGVRGYVLRSDGPHEVVRAIRTVASGQTFICPEATNTLLSAVVGLPASAPGRMPVRLSPREHQVLVLVAEGLRTKEIAARLGVGPRTIDTHRARLMKKLKCGTTVELVRAAIREGIAPV